MSKLPQSADDSGLLSVCNFLRDVLLRSCGIATPGALSLPSSLVGKLEEVIKKHICFDLALLVLLHSQLVEPEERLPAKRKEKSYENKAEEQQQRCILQLGALRQFMSAFCIIRLTSNDIYYYYLFSVSFCPPFRSSLGSSWFSLNCIRVSLCVALHLCLTLAFYLTIEA